MLFVFGVGGGGELSCHNAKFPLEAQRLACIMFAIFQELFTVSHGMALTFISGN